jgi:hypothetical protein
MDKVWYKSKTIITAFVMTILGMADLLGAIDITPILTLAGVPADKASGVVLMLSIGFAFLRTKTTGSVTISKTDTMKAVEAVTASNVAAVVATDAVVKAATAEVTADVAVAKVADTAKGA